jgi:hypothetical protein
MKIYALASCSAAVLIYVLSGNSSGITENNIQLLELKK